MDWSKVARPVFDYTNCGAKFPWPKSESEHQKLVSSLTALVPSEDWRTIFPYEEKERANRQIRRALAPYLSGPDRKLAADLCSWVVRDWGGIKSGDKKAPGKWSDQVTDYSRSSIDNFVQAMGRRRISSWSKMLAFAAPETEVIYDSRTAVAINCALAHHGMKTGFFMPAGRNPSIIPADRELRRLGLKQEFGYSHYVQLLRQIAASHEDGDILGVEMSLFANAPEVARKFVAASVG